MLLKVKKKKIVASTEITETIFTSSS